MYKRKKKLKYNKYMQKQTMKAIQGVNLLPIFIPERKILIRVKKIKVFRFDDFDFEKYQNDTEREQEFHKWLDLYLKQRQVYWGSKSKLEIIELLRHLPESEPEFGMWEFPKKYQNDRDICKVYLEKRGLQFVPTKFLNDEEMMLWYIQKHKGCLWMEYPMISEKLRNNVAFISQAMEVDSDIFFFAGAKVKNDKYMIIQEILLDPDYYNCLSNSKKKLDADIQHAYEISCRNKGLEPLSQPAC